MKLNSKDLICIVIFATIYFVLVIILIHIAFVPASQLISMPLIGLLTGPFYLIFIAKLGKFGGVLEIADGLYNDCKISEYGSYHDEVWEQKYVDKTYTSREKVKRTNQNKIILLPDFKKLKNEVEKLRTELSMLVLERDELLYVQCKNIEMEYMLKLGSLEYKAYEAQCAALRLKRKIELIQAKKNRQEKISVSQIEEVLDDEFAKYQKQLNEQVEKMNDALKRNAGEFLSDEDTKELKKLYRTVVKNLHPDLNPDISETQVSLFEKAVDAYKNGDLGTLRIIGEMVGEHSLPDKKQDAMSQLVSEKKRLDSILVTVKDSIEKIKSEYPYTVKDIIENSDKTAERKAELESILEQYQMLIENYTERIDEMMR